VVNADELWRALARADELPVEAIESSLAHWDEVSDRYLAKLRAQASGAKLSDADHAALFFAIHMFAEKRDQRAYAPLCAEISKDFDDESWLGDAMSETLVSLLISLFDGDPGPLHMVAEAPNADALARVSAIYALGYVTRADQAIPEEATRAWLMSFGKELTDAEDPLLGAAWALTVAALGYDDFGPEVARALSRGAIDGDFYSIKEFHADLHDAHSDPQGPVVFLREGMKPFGTTLETMSEWQWGLDADEDLDAELDLGEDLPGPSETPYVNPLRDVGRNDPCPCGSGKKYKKCCLAA
jgi:hypothetical protein